MNMLDTIILAGGMGTRLRAIVPHLPKPLAPINGIPILDYIFNHLSEQKASSKVILALGYRSHQIINRYQDHTYSFPIEFSLEESFLGTGGAIRLALEKVITEDVLILNGDTFLDFSFKQFYEMHRMKEADLTIAYSKVDDMSQYGALQIDDETQRILHFQEKSLNTIPGDINTGIYLMKSSLLFHLPLNKAFSLEKEVFPLFIKRRVFGYHCPHMFIDMGTPKSYQEAQKLLTLTTI